MSNQTTATYSRLAYQVSFRGLVLQQPVQELGCLCARTSAMAFFRHQTNHCPSRKIPNQNHIYLKLPKSKNMIISINIKNWGVIEGYFFLLMKVPLLLCSPVMRGD